MNKDDVSFPDPQNIGECRDIPVEELDALLLELDCNLSAEALKKSNKELLENIEL